MKAFDRLTIRWRIMLLTLAILLPVALVLAWFLAADVRHAREAALREVSILARGTADDVQRLLGQTATMMARLAERPLVKAMDPARCDPLLAEFVQLNPEHVAIAVRDRDGRAVCSHRPDGKPLPADARQFPWFEAALRGDRFMASNLFMLPDTQTRVTALTQPIRDADGRTIGVLVLPIDLLRLGERLLAAVPKNAVVTVLDRDRTVLLRSASAPRYVGSPMAASVPDPARGAREGTLEGVGRDGVPRLFSYVTLPDLKWRVAASLPIAEVFAEYRRTLARTMALGLGVMALAVWLAWQLSGTIVRPSQRLQATIARVTAGELAARATLEGPPEVRAIAEQVNRLLASRNLSSARLAGIFDSALDGILTTNEQQVIVDANPAAARMFRCPREMLIGAPLERFIPEQYRRQHRLEVEQFGASDQAGRHMATLRDVTALRADGSEFPIEASISSAVVDGERLYTVIHRDITARRQVQAELLAGKAQLEAALASMTDSVFISDAQGHFVHFNEAFAGFYRFRSKAECPTDIADYIALLEVRTAAGDIVPPERWPMARALRGEQASRVEYRLQRKDSGERWIGSFSFAPIRGAQGDIVGSVVTGHDITEWRQVQAALESSHADLKRLLNAVDQVQELERKRIALELHDDLQQTLAAIRLDAGAIVAERERRPEAVAELARRIDTLASTAIASTRRIINDLRPQMLEDLGLAAALDSLAAQFTQRCGIACAFDAVGDETVFESLGSDIATCLYRVAQEALNNVAKHAGARQVEMHLEALAGGGLRLRVQDDGQGIGEGDRHKKESFGLRGMAERVRAAGGALRVERADGGGTRVQVELPGAPSDGARGA
ncbi:PAS domain S-box protein [Aquabacterium sp.]|uniref:PAS domain S-box protein n=1 Tax=Aquabacterium sp. TaxID=1872578 RepID=UPI003782E9B1